MTTKKPIQNIEQFHRWSKKLKGEMILYRGLSDADYPVEASALRRFEEYKKNSAEDKSKKSTTKNIDIELFRTAIVELLEEARRRGHGNKNGKKLTDLELITVLQHYGAATCLIDFTTNPMIALWFACNQSECFGRVIAIRSDQTEKFHTITYEQMEEHSIRYFLSGDILYKWDPPTKIDNRILAQQSIFMLGKQNIERQYYEEVEIDKEQKASILDELKKYGITDQYLFPDLAGFSFSKSHNKPYIGYSAEHYFYLGVQSQQRKESEQAIAYYNKAILYGAKFPEVYNSLGNIKHNLRDYGGAIENYNEAIRINPLHAETYNNRGIVKHKIGDYREAVNDYNEAIRLKPQFFGCYCNRGNAMKLLGNYADAINDYNTAIQINPQLVEAYSNRASVYHDLKEYHRAIKDYNAAIQLNSQYMGAYYNRGNTKNSLNLYQSAIEDFNEAIRINPQYAEAYNSRGNAKKSLESYWQAMIDYNKAIQLDPQHFNSYHNRGDINCILKKYWNAIQDYDKAIEINPESSEIYESRGMAKREVGDLQEAEADFQRAQKIRENNS